MNSKSRLFLLHLLVCIIVQPYVNAQCTTSTVPSLGTGCVYGDAIDAFTLNSVSTSTNYGCNNGTTSYQFYSSPVRTLTIGSTYPFSATVGTSGSISYTEYFAIWVDYNKDGVYSGSSELAFASNSKGNTHTGSITIPNNAATGTVKMRTRCKYDQPKFTASDACQGYYYGETEDYDVTLVCPTVGTFSVSVSASATTICAGTSVTFTATPTNGGSTPSYQWKKNGTNVGTNSTTYTDAGLANGDVITCVMGHTFTCVGTTTSNSVTMTVNPSVTPSVSISPSPSGTVCGNASVTFTPTPTNGGAAPTYQWKKNGSNVTTGATYTNSTWVNGDIVTAVMTSNATCPNPTTATSNSVTMSVTPFVTPSVSIAVSPGNSFCPGTNATFTATPTNGGSTPAYQWKKNGSNVGTNSATYSDNTLTTGDVITCVLTSSACASPTTATSNSITINTSFPASVSVTINTLATVCAGTPVTFTATPTNGGAPSYQWKKNGGNVGTNSNVFTDVPGNGDSYNVQMTSSIACASPKPATSNTVTINHATPVTPSVTITKSPNGAICPGTAVVFNATPTNGGPTPSYQWKLNGNNVGTNSANYTNTGTLVNNDVVSVVMTSSLCASPTSATSNTTITVNSNTTPSVTIAVNPGNAICGGTAVTFTATALNAGSAPAYQWKKNGSNVGTNSATYNAGTTLANGDVITCVVTSNNTCPLPAAATSNAITMNVTSTVTPTVTVTANPSAASCFGASVIFTAAPFGGGSAPVFQWKIDGNVVGTNSNSYTDPGQMSAGTHSVTCTMTSNYSCKTTSTATGTLSRVVNPTLVPSITISSAQAPGGDICAGSSVTFTAATVNPGAAPTYNWKKNGVSVSTTSTYPAGTTLATGDVITCQMTSNATCAAPAVVNSNAVTVTSWPNLTTSVTIASSVGPTVGCLGLPVVFTATPVNVGSAPTYQWKKNSVVVGTNSPTYSDAGLTSGNTITCTVTPSIPCALPKPVTSNTITMTMNPVITATINITVTPDSMGCEGTPKVFSAFFTNPGTSPTYKWYLNGNVIAGAAQSVYSSNSLNDGDVVACEMASSLVCAFPVISDAITMHLTAVSSPSVEIGGYPDTNGSITFYSTVNNAGSAPTYQWLKNGENITGATSATYHSVNHQPNDKIALLVHSSALCANPENVLSKSLQPIQVTSVGDLSSAMGNLKLFPNPNDGRFSIKGTVQKTGGEAAIEVLNAVGQVVYKESVKLTKAELDVDVNLGGRAVSGMYMVRITIDGNTESMRFVLK